MRFHEVQTWNVQLFLFCDVHSPVAMLYMIVYNWNFATEN